MSNKPESRVTVSSLLVLELAELTVLSLLLDLNI